MKYNNPDNDVPGLFEDHEDSLMVVRDGNELGSILSRLGENEMFSNVRPRREEVEVSSVTSEPRHKRPRQDQEDNSNLYKLMETFAKTQDMIVKHVLSSKEKDKEQESEKEENMPDKPERLVTLDWPAYHVQDDSVTIIDAKL